MESEILWTSLAHSAKLRRLSWSSSTSSIHCWVTIGLKVYQESEREFSMNPLALPIYINIIYSCLLIYLWFEKTYTDLDWPPKLDQHHFKDLRPVQEEGPTLSVECANLISNARRRWSRCVCYIRKRKQMKTF